MAEPFNTQITEQREVVVEETRQWVRGWDANNERWYFGFWKKKYGTTS